MGQYKYITRLAKVNGTNGLLSLRNDEKINNIKTIRENFINGRYPMLIKFVTKIDKYGRWRKTEIPDFIATVTNINELYKRLKFREKTETEEFEIKICYNLDDIITFYNDLVENDTESFSWKKEDGFIRYIPTYNNINYKGKLNHLYPLGDGMLLAGESGDDNEFHPLFVASEDKISGYSEDINDIPHLKDIKNLYIINFNQYL